jgi:hypothetical protein
MKRVNLKIKIILFFVLYYSVIIYSNAQKTQKFISTASLKLTTTTNNKNNKDDLNNLELKLQNIMTKPDLKQNKKSITKNNKINKNPLNMKCDEIKKLGQQKKYCENKYLLTESDADEENEKHNAKSNTMNCLRSFCDDCCGEDKNCKSICSYTHSVYSDHDPEGLLISVCAYQNMGPSFDKFCKPLLNENNRHDYEECYKNFCFDCCSNELKITLYNDPEIEKCLNICKPSSIDSVINFDSENNNSNGINNNHKYESNIFIRKEIEKEHLKLASKININNIYNKIITPKENEIIVNEISFKDLIINKKKHFPFSNIKNGFSSTLDSSKILKENMDNSFLIKKEKFQSSNNENKIKINEFIENKKINVNDNNSKKSKFKNKLLRY